MWNESFEVMIPSRVGAKFGFEINDWDRVGPLLCIYHSLTLDRSAPQRTWGWVRSISPRLSHSKLLSSSYR